MRKKQRASEAFSSGEQTRRQPVAQVAQELRVSQRFVTTCWATVVAQHLGRSLVETAPLPTPRWLGLDGFARRKGHRYDTIVCDLEHRQVVEISAGRTLAEVSRLLARFDTPARVEAVSIDRNASFHEAIGLSLLRSARMFRRSPAPRSRLSKMKRWALTMLAKLSAYGKRSNCSINGR